MKASLLIFLLAAFGVRAADPSLVSNGQKLFDHNCGHCHGDDARGDEGPDLHDLRISDARIQRILNNGIKGEMPAFGKKFSDDDIKAITAWIRSLKDK